MKLTTVTNVSLDGVTQGHRRIDVGTRGEGGVPGEDGSDGFERFGWGPPLLDDEAYSFIGQTFQRADAFLLGRRTYEIFAGSWGAGMDPGNPVGDALNTRPKYVASTTLRDPCWAHDRLVRRPRGRRRRAASRARAASCRCGAAAP
jgi:dihydrofolate reductase